MTNTHPASFSVRDYLAIPAAVFCIIFLGFLVLALEIHAEKEESLRLLVADNAVLIGSQFERNLEAQATALVRMASRQQIAPEMDEEIWRVDARNYLRDFPALKMIALNAPDAGMHWKQASGDGDSFYAAVRNQAWPQAKESGKSDSGAVYTMDASGLKLFAWCPLVPGKESRGYIVGGFDAEELLHNGLSALAQKYYSVTFGSAYPGASEAPYLSEMPLRTGGLSLPLKVWPSKALLTSRADQISGTVFAAGCCVALLAAVAAHYLRRFIKQSVLLREQELGFQLLVDGVDDYAIYILDPKGHVKSWNSGAQKIKGYTRQEILGRHFSVFYTQEDARKGIPDEALVTATRSGKYQAESMRVRKDGSEFWASVLIEPLYDPKKRLIGFAKVTRDITKRHRLEGEREALINKLADSNKELERFAFIASHDLQEPVRLICNFTELLRKNGDSASAKEYIDIILTSAKRMHLLITDLLEYAVLGSSDEMKEWFNTHECLDSVTETLQGVIAHTNAEIVYGDLPNLKGSSVRFVTLMQNLIGNALKYRRADIKPRIVIEACETQADWIFYVRDNGIGIKPEYCDQIFEPFKRLHTAREYPGTGMGLAICRKIVDQFGGRIWVESALGQGSVFCFSVPRRSAQVHPAAEVA